MPQPDALVSSDAARFRFLVENAFAAHSLRMDGTAAFRFSGSPRLGAYPARNVREAIDAWMASCAAFREAQPVDTIGVF